MDPILLLRIANWPLKLAFWLVRSIYYWFVPPNESDHHNPR